MQSVIHQFSGDGKATVIATRAAASCTRCWGLGLRMAEQVAYFLSKLDSVQEGDRTLLDNTVVL